MKIFVLLILLCLNSGAYSAERVALLIGNSNYDLPTLSLKNPSNDVAAMAEKLRSIGFEVTEVLDADGLEMEIALVKFQKVMAGAEVGLFYYGGHGVEVDGENYLIASDFTDLKTGNLTRAAMSMGRVRDAIAAAAPKIGLVILDACRNNPFAQSGAVSPGLSRAQGALGLLIAFAAEPRKVAFDGIGDNSVFTQALLNNIATDGLEVRIMLGRVRQEVALITHGGQAPLVEDGTLGENYLGSPVLNAAANDAFATEMAIWRVASAGSDTGPLQDYLTQYPDGLFASFAKDRIAGLGNAINPSLTNSTFVELVKVDPLKTGTALAEMGFIAKKPQYSEAQLTDAFAAYGASLAEPAAANLNQLYQDAAREMTYLAAATAQKLRTDLVALSSVERTLVISNSMLDEIKAIAGSDPDAAPVLQAAESDIAQIELSRERIMIRLDGTRTYYDEQLKTGYRFFKSEVSAVARGMEISAGTLSEIEKTLSKDAGNFARQVAEMTPDSEATMAWLADFVPQG